MILRIRCVAAPVRRLFVFFVVIAITSGVEKLEWVATMQMVKKFDDMFSCLDTTLACVRPIDGRRDILRQQNHSISR